MKSCSKTFLFENFLSVCCSIINCNAKAIDELSEHQIFDDEASLFQRAAPRLGRASPRLGRASPRLGRASPRLGRASPRLGRQTAALLLSHLNQFDDSASDSHYENELDVQDKRAAPRLGRAVKSIEQQNKN